MLHGFDGRILGCEKVALYRRNPGNKSAGRKREETSGLGNHKGFGKAFKELQRSLRIPKEEQIEFQGLRKSGQMHKVRLTQNNYQLVAENSGQSPEVLMSNYNEAREIEKRALAAMVERSFYPEIAVSTPQAASIMEVLNQNPDLAGQILKNLLLQTAYAQPNTTVTG